MANLYLIDRPSGENGLALAAADQAPGVVLIQDGVYLDTSRLAADSTVYAVRKDLERRGLLDSVGAKVQVIDYGELVDLVLQYDRVVNFA